MLSRIFISLISLALWFWKYGSTRNARREAKKTVPTNSTLVMLNPLCLKTYDHHLISFKLFCRPYLLTLLSWIARRKLRPLRKVIIFRVVWLNNNKPRGDLSQNKSCEGEDPVKEIHSFLCSFLYYGRYQTDDEIAVISDPGTYMTSWHLKDPRM